MAGAGAGDQAVGLETDQALPGVGVVQTDRLGDTDEAHGPLVEGLDHGGRVAKLESAQRVLHTLGPGRRTEREVGLGPVGQSLMDLGQ